MHRESSSFSYYGCEHSATQSYQQRSTMPMFIAREMEEGDVPKEETLGDYLQEYESQTHRFRYHVNFQAF